MILMNENKTEKIECIINNSKKYKTLKKKDIQLLIGDLYDNR